MSKRCRKRFGLSPDQHRTEAAVALRVGLKRAWDAKEALDRGANAKTCPIAYRELSAAYRWQGEVVGHEKSGGRGAAGTDRMGAEIEKVASAFRRLCLKKR